MTRGLAGTLPLVIEQGATFDWLLTWKTGDPLALVDLTGCTAQIVARENDFDGDVLFNLTSAGGDITLGGAAGTIRTRMAPVATAALAFDMGYYTLDITTGGGDVRRLLQGSVRLSRETKP